jgi:hypothetical protein
VPHETARHEEPGTWRATFRRRFNYGTAAAALSLRHPGRLTHTVLHPWAALGAAAALSGRRGTALVLTGAHGVVISRRLRNTGVHPATGFRHAGAGVAYSVIGIGHALTMFAAPLLAVGLTSRKTRGAALVLLVASPLHEWRRARPPIDPIRWTALTIADDVAYGVGVVVGCARNRTAEPLFPTTKGPA